MRFIIELSSGKFRLANIHTSWFLNLDQVKSWVIQNVKEYKVGDALNEIECMREGDQIEVMGKNFL